MRLRPRTFEQFGPWLLLRRIESDPFCETWRARIASAGSEPELFAVRRFPAIPSAAANAAANHASSLLASLKGPSIARQQKVRTIDGEMALVHEYEGGRSLAHLVERSRNPTNGRVPLPEDLALTIIEKVMLALETTHEFIHEDSRTIHGGLLPHFVWVTADGEVRLSGQELGRGVSHALSHETAAPVIRPFLAPEVVLGKNPTPQSDIYSAGALLYLLLTGDPPPECRTAAQNLARIHAGRSCLSGDPLQTDVQAILIRSLAPDPQLRYQSASDMREAITKKLHGQSVGPTTFNLAFFLHTLLRKDFESERAERALETAAGSERSGAPAVPRETGARRRTALIAALVILLLGSAITAAYIRFSPRRATQKSGAAASVDLAKVPPAGTPSASATVTQPVTREPAAQPVIDDAAARERAFEAAVNARLEQEMAKLQASHDEEIRRQRLAAQRSRSEADRGAAAIPRSSEEEASGASPTLRAREGQLVEISSVDQEPVAVRTVQPSYPQEAVERRIEGNVIISALVSETGRVLDTRVMRGDTREAGLDEAAIAAVRQWQFTPAVKDGQRVRTWAPVAVSFKLPD